MAIRRGDQKCDAFSSGCRCGLDHSLGKLRMGSSPPFYNYDYANYRLVDPYYFVINLGEFDRGGGVKEGAFEESSSRFY